MVLGCVGDDVAYVVKIDECGALRAAVWRGVTLSHFVRGIRCVSKRVIDNLNHNCCFRLHPEESREFRWGVQMQQGLSERSEEALLELE